MTNNSTLITEFQERNFQESLTFPDNQRLLIKFYAPWCDDCQNIDPLYHSLAEKHSSSLQFAQINIDCHEMRDYYQSLGITEIPSFAVYQSKEQYFIRRGDNQLREFVAEVADNTISFLDLKEKWSAEAEDKRRQREEETSPISQEYDLLVIGGGSGGNACAKLAAKYVDRVAIVDWVEPSKRGNVWDFGGTCPNVGCIPKFLFHEAAHMGERLKEHAEYFGWNVNSPTHNWSKLQESVQLHVKKLNWKYERALRASKVEYIHAKAEFTASENVMKLTDADGKSFLAKAKYVVIATGGRPVYPDFEGSEEHCITSDDVFFLKSAPGKTLVVGGSYIALETAGFLASLGMDVTLSVRERMLRPFDEECVSKAADSLVHAGVNVDIGKQVQRVQRAADDENGKYLVTFEDKENRTTTDQFDTVFVATGRSPNTSSLNLKDAEVKVDEKGYIQVNDYNQTSAKNVYALGDVVGNAPELTPVAILAGKLLARRLFLHTNRTEKFIGAGDGNKVDKLDSVNFVPTVIFTPNEYSSVGLNEDEANKKYGSENVRVYRKTVRVLANELNPDHPHDAFGKLITLRKEDERVVGFHFVGPKAGEVIQGMAVALSLGVKKQDLDLTVGLHPTVAEMFTSLEYGVEEDTGCGCG